MERTERHHGWIFASHTSPKGGIHYSLQLEKGKTGRVISVGMGENGRRRALRMVQKALPLGRIALEEAMMGQEGQEFRVFSVPKDQQ